MERVGFCDDSVLELRAKAVKVRRTAWFSTSKIACLAPLLTSGAFTAFEALRRSMLSPFSRHSPLYLLLAFLLSANPLNQPCRSSLPILPILLPDSSQSFSQSPLSLLFSAPQVKPSPRDKEGSGKQVLSCPACALSKPAETLCKYRCDSRSPFLRGGKIQGFGVRARRRDSRLFASSSRKRGGSPSPPTSSNHLPPVPPP